MSRPELVCKGSKCALSDLLRQQPACPTKQAGFRKRETQTECGLNTHVLFIDIRKAFDTVPVGALLWKLQNMGFPRRTLAFLKALYTSSSARARAGSLLSDHSQYREVSDRDVHCLDSVQFVHQRHSRWCVAPITVPGLPRDTNPIRGLMYADDVAVLLI
ncbi:hypothetical protein BASA83_005036 [Batrachochytrium salamandrivorans]|nr:hypothetical protein BASA83_005036 [Batrachochytrium salamandrivorans]